MDEIFHAIDKEYQRQSNQIELIASENIVSENVLRAQGSILTNKYAEGYPDRRYYAGCEYVDSVEQIAIEKACELFGAKYANVQPHSGSQANQAVFLALLKPGDTILGMSLDAGGHLTHGSRVNMSGKWFNAVSYGLGTDELIDMDKVKEIAQKEKPKLIIAGGSAYSREINTKRFREIADSVDAYLLFDMSHISGLVAAGYHPNPIEHAHIVTSTTHKTLRGPRGGIVLTNDPQLIKKINSALFPGLQGGPLMHVIAAKAVAFCEALQPKFKKYIRRVIDNSRMLADTMTSRGYHIVSGGTDTHLFLLSLEGKGVTGAEAEKLLEDVGISCNKNCIPNDALGPRVTSGLRLGTPAITTRGFTTDDVNLLGNLICDVIEKKIYGSIAEKIVLELCEKNDKIPRI